MKSGVSAKKGPGIEPMAGKRCCLLSHVSSQQNQWKSARYVRVQEMNATDTISGKKLNVYAKDGQRTREIFKYVMLLVTELCDDVL